MDLRSILMGVTFAFMWSSAFATASIIVKAAPPFSALSIRFLISGIMGVLIARALGQSWRLTPGQWRACILFGVCQNTLYLGLSFVALQTIDASLAVIISSTMPLLVALFAWAFLGERLTMAAALGLFAGLGGVVVIMGSRFSGGVDLYGVVLCVLGVVALAIATLAVRGATSGGNFMMVVGLQMLMASVLLGGMAAATETLSVTWSWRFIAAFSWTLIVPGLIATLIWFKLVERINATRAATFHFLNPFFGVAIAAILLGETLRLTDTMGVLIIMIGILAVQLSRRSGRERTVLVSPP